MQPAAALAGKGETHAASPQQGGVRRSGGRPSRPAEGGGPAALLHLQHLAGNLAVAELLSAGAQGGLAQLMPVQTCGVAHPDCDCPPAQRLATATAQRTRRPVQRETGAEAVAEHTGLVNLDEAALGARAAERVKAGDYGFMNEVLDELGWTNLDDVSYEVMVLLTDAELDAMVTGGGNALLTRMYDHLTAGSLADEEQAEADRILRARSRALGEESFATAAGSGDTMIFPWRPPGLFVVDDAIINAERRDEGKVWVEMPVRVSGSDTYAEDVATLPSQVFTSGIEIAEDQIVGVRRYDLGGEVEYRPATYLLQIANQTDTRTLETAGEAAAIGLTLGSGELLALGYEASMLARVLLWADRAAFVIGLITTALRDHRGWIISTFGDDGKEFLKCVDVAHSAVAMYGMARAVVGAFQVFMSLRQWHSNWKALRAGADDISDARAADLLEVDQHVDELLESADDMRAARGGDADVPEGQPPLDVDQGGPVPRGDTDVPEGPAGGPRGGAADLDAADQAFLDATTDLTAKELTPSDIDRELDIAQRAGTRSERDGKVVYDLPNGHSWELHPDGTMCRHSALEHCLLFQSFPLEGHLARILANDIGVQPGQTGPLGNIRRRLAELNERIRQRQIGIDDARKEYATLARDTERVRPGTVDEMADPAALTGRMGQLEQQGTIAAAGDVQIVGRPDAGHEGPQAVSYGRIEGGGTFEFSGDAQQGIEGVFRPARGGDPIPVSLKDFSFSDNIEGLIGKLNQNARRIPPEHAGDVHLHVRVHQWTTQVVQEFIEGGDQIILNMPSEGIFRRMYFECSDGILELTDGGLRAL